MITVVLLGVAIVFAVGVMCINMILDETQAKPVVGFMLSTIVLAGLFVVCFIHRNYLDFTDDVVVSNTTGQVAGVNSLELLLVLAYSLLLCVSAPLFVVSIKRMIRACCKKY